MADNKPTILGGTAIKPKERHGWEAVRYLIHNPETGEYFTRTPKSWLLIFIFYVIYYACLAGFWAAMLNIFFLTIPEDQPKWTTEESIIGISPGLGLRPKQADINIDSSIIQFSLGDDAYDGIESYKDWVNRTKVFVETIDKAQDKGQLAKLGSCALGNFGYDEGRPCVFLKLNKIFDLVNTAYDGTAVPFPEKMPENLQTLIAAQGLKDQVWVECHGQYPADTEAMGRLIYYPDSQGFPNDKASGFFPYTRQSDYESPIVAVQFDNPARNQLLHVECRAWAKNIGYDKRDRVGINLFELHILEAKSAAEMTKEG